MKRLNELTFWTGLVLVLIGGPVVIAHLALPAQLFTVPTWGYWSAGIGVLLMLVAYLRADKP